MIGAANIIECKKHSVRYVDECYKCVSEERDALREELAQIHRKIKGIITYAEAMEISEGIWKEIQNKQKENL